MDPNPHTPHTPYQGTGPGGQSGPRSGSGSWRQTAGRVFAGRFELLEELGRGGVGVVMRARDLQRGGEVALKVLRDPALARSVVAERLRREGTAAGALNHPGIVRLHASGEAGGLPWLAFELVPECRTLTRAWRGKDLATRVGWVRDAAAALGHAHRHGVVHRDVKPSNLLVDAEGRLRVTDFGVALSDEWERITRSGIMLGTPTHMAPEQVESRRGAIGPWSDVWALGVILYQALTGELPFTGDTLLEISAKVVEARLTPPRELAPEVSPALEAVCLDCLRVNPRERPLDGETLVRRLEQALRASPGPAVGRGRGLRRALIAGLGAASALVLVLLGVLVGRGSAGSQENPPVGGGASSAAGGGRDTAWLGSASLAELQQAAAGGEPAAWTALGRAYRTGRFAPPDQGEARRAFERAAALDDPDGAVELARVLVAAGDPAAARRWLERAVGLGSLAGRIELAPLLAAGQGGPADPVRAAALLREARPEDDPALLAVRARAASEGWGGAPDLAAAAALWRRAAEGGSVPGMLGWAAALSEGQGVGEDDATAALWFRRAGESGNAEAMARYALMLGDGEGVPEDQAAARRWLEEAVAAGEPLAGYALGMYLSLGLGGPRDEPRAREVYRQAAERGHVESMAKLGELLLDGKGGAKDEAAGRVWLERAARTGDPEGMRRYGLALWLREGCTESERAEGREWIHRSAQLGHPPGMTFWGVILICEQDDPVEGRAMLEKAAARGEPVAMYELAWRLLKGVDFPRDTKLGRRWLEQAAQHHHRDAQEQLGLLLCGLTGEPPDYPAARTWLSRAGEGARGTPEAQFQLGELLAEGRGGARDEAGAQVLWRRAAAQGHPVANLRLGSASFARGEYRGALEHWSIAAQKGQADACIGLGLMYMRGQGVTKDARRAAEAFQEASRLGNHDGAILLALVVHEGGPGLTANPVDALDLMQQIALDTGDPLACRWTGVWLVVEPATAADGRRWLEKAAQGGDMVGMERLAEVLRQGLGGPVDEAAAARWEREAREARAREEQD